MSSLFLSVWAVRGTHNDFGVIGAWGTDHVSHIGSAVLFGYRGFDIYRRPMAELCQAGDAEARAASARDRHPECQLSERRGRRPLIIGWAQYPSFYPPGALLIHAPAALLWNFSDWSINAICNLQVIIYVLFSQLAIYLAGFLLLGFRPGAEGTPLGPQGLLLPWLWMMLSYWALSGFYDVVLVCILFGAALAGFHRRWGWALLLMSLALFCHFRALWSAPLFVFAAIQLAPQRPWRALTPPRWIAGALMIILLGLFAAAFFMVYPKMRLMGVTNPAYWKANPADSAALWSVGLTCTAVLVDCILVRNWLTAASVVWQAVFVIATPETHFWHALAALPLLAIAQLDRDRVHATWSAFLLIGVEWVCVYSTIIGPGNLIVDLLRHNA